MDTRELLPYFLELADVEGDETESELPKLHPDIEKALELYPWLDDFSFDIYDDDSGKVLLNFHYRLDEKLRLINKYLHINVMHLRGAHLLVKAEFVVKWLTLLDECMTQEKAAKDLGKSFRVFRRLLSQQEKGHFLNHRFEPFTMAEAVKRWRDGEEALPFHLYIKALEKAPKKKLTKFQKELLTLTKGEQLC